MQDWSGTHASVVVALLPSSPQPFSGLLAQPSTWRAVTLLACAFVLSTAFLAVIHYGGDPAWLKHLPAAPGGDGVMWQVQTTFLAVGFAGLAIAAQLFAEAPLAIGASRERVLEHVWAGLVRGRRPCRQCRHCCRDDLAAERTGRLGDRGLLVRAYRCLAVAVDAQADETIRPPLLAG